MCGAEMRLTETNCGGSAAAELQVVMRAWPALPAAMRAGILAMIRAAGVV